MFLKQLKLLNFRNYQTLEYDFNTPITVLIGDNAQGKSNFLESIYFLATTKSSRADKDEELISSDQNLLRVESQVIKDVKNPEDITNLEIVMYQQQEGYLSKKVKVNGIPRRILDYIGNLSVVVFTPEDINLVTGSPSLRRWHIDLTLAQINRDYKKSLTLYEDVLTRKNKLLKAIKEGISSIDELDFWLDQQLFYGQIVSDRRREFFEFINSTEKKFGNFEFKLIQSPLTKERLLEYREKEIASSSSLIGPHRDDFKFLEFSSKTNSLRDLSKFGSRGEQRTAVLDLKVSEVYFIEQSIKTRPILLLDDVFSELDHSHREHVLELIKLQQTILATVELEAFLKDLPIEITFLKIVDGKLSVITDK